MIITIHVPEKAKILVKSGQNVDFNIPFYEIATHSDIELSLSRKLGIAPKKIFNYLKKFVGEEIKKDEILAVKKSFFSTQKIVSEYEGTIKEINHDTGNMIISIATDAKNQVDTFFKGEITEIGEKGIKLKVKEGKSFPLKNTGGDFGGNIFYVKDSNENSIIYPNIFGKLLFVSLLTSYLQSKVEALGIAGYISLHKLPIQTPLPSAQLKEIEDEKTIMKNAYQYCITDSKSSTITFYQ